MDSNTYTNKPPPELVGQPVGSAGQPPYPAGQPADNAGQPPYPTGQPTGNAGQPPYPTGQPAGSAGQLPYPTGQPDNPAGQAPYPTGQPTSPPAEQAAGYQAGAPVFTNPQPSAQQPGHPPPATETTPITIGGQPQSYTDLPPTYNDAMAQKGAGMPPAQPQMAPVGMAATHTTVVTATTPTVIVGTNMYNSSRPVYVQCRQCRQMVTTDVVYRNGWLVWLSCGMLCLFGCWLGCCLIPFCIHDLKNATHYCPNCKTLLGESQRL